MVTSTFLVHNLDQDHGSDHTTTGGHVGVDHNVGHFNGAGGIAESQNRTTVKSIPAHPQDEGTQGGQRNVGTWHRVNATIFTVLAFTGTKDDSTGQSGPTADRCERWWNQRNQQNPFRTANRRPSPRNPGSGK